jgi:hypothetical protein
MDNVGVGTNNAIIYDCKYKSMGSSSMDYFFSPVFQALKAWLIKVLLAACMH